MHNVLNALACIALCDYYGISSNHIQSALQKFTGAHRRFEYKGTVNNALYLMTMVITYRNNSNC